MSNLNPPQQVVFRHQGARGGTMRTPGIQSPRHSDVDLTELRQLIADQQVLVVTGSAVAGELSRHNRLTTWLAHIDSGIEWCEPRIAERQGDARWGEHVRNMLGIGLGLAGEQSVLGVVAELLVSEIGGEDSEDYGRWLEESLGSLRQSNRDLGLALAGIGAPIVSLTADNLLEQCIGWPGIPWREPYIVQRTLAGKEPAVIHPFGRWDSPSSVRLGGRDSNAFGHTRVAEILMESLVGGKRLLLVGLNDLNRNPNTDSFVRWITEGSPNLHGPHYWIETEPAIGQPPQSPPPAKFMVIPPDGDLTTRLTRIAPPRNRTKTSPARRPGPRRVSNLPTEAFASAFVGRESLFEDITRRLRSDPSGPSVCVLSGIMGMGKSRTAVEYAQRHQNEYDVIWWLPAEQVVTARQGLALLAPHLDLPDVGDIDQASEAVRQRLQEHGRHLLIVDNLESFSGLASLIPAGGSGHVLVTTRLSIDELPENVLGLHVPPLTMHEALRVLSGDDTVNEAELRKVCVELGYLPQALRTAGSTLAAGTPVRQLLASIRRHESDGQRAGLVGQPGLSASLALALASLRRMDSDAAEFIQLCAFLGPTSVRPEMFVEPNAHSVLPTQLRNAIAGPADVTAFMRAAGSVGLAEWVSDTFTMHRLTQHYIRTTLTHVDRRRWEDLATALLLRLFPEDSTNPSSWVSCATYLPYALNIGEARDLGAGTSPEKAVLLTRCANYLFARAEFTESAPVYRRAAAIQRSAVGIDKNYATIVGNMGLARLSRGDVRSAINSLTRALELRTNLLDAGNPEIAAAYNNLGCAYREASNLERADELLKIARSLYEPIRESDPGGYAMAANNLGVVWSQMRIPEAFALLQRALLAEREIPGPRNIDIAISLNNLSIAYAADGDYAASEKSLREALDLVRATRSEEHPDNAGILNNLGIALRGQGKIADALPYFNAALKIEEDYYGKNHPEVAGTLNNLGVTLRHLNRYVSALQAQERALEIFTRSGDGHLPRREAAVHGGLGNMYRRLGDVTNAIRHHRMALALEKTIYPEGDYELAGTYDNLGRALRHAGLLDESIENFQHGLRIKRAALPPNSLEIAKTLDNLGVSYRFAENHQAAVEAHGEALKIRQDHETDLRGRHYSLVGYALACRCLGRDDDAAEALDAARALETFL